MRPLWNGFLRPQNPFAMARESLLMMEVVVGPRDQESATKLVEGAASRIVPNCWPLWLSDGWEPHLFALTVVYAVLIHFIKGIGPGRPKESHVVPDPRLRYGQVIKHRVGRRLISVTRRVVVRLNRNRKDWDRCHDLVSWSLTVVATTNSR